MNTLRALRRYGAPVLPLAILVACATKPVATPTVAPAPPPAPAKLPSDYGRMAPIPNPPESTPAPLHRPARPAKPSPAPEVATAPPAPKAAPNAARAAALRAQSLEAMDRGHIDEAVALLQQASELDPDNALIRRDLERAHRIQTVVNTK